MKIKCGQEKPTFSTSSHAITVGSSLYFRVVKVYKIIHRDLVHMEGTAHIDFPKFETAEAINFKILPVMHM